MIKFFLFVLFLSGFALLCQQDQMVLVKSGLFEILTIQDSIELILYDAFVLNEEVRISKENIMKFMPVELYQGIYTFAERLNMKLRLTRGEIALLSAVVLFADGKRDGDFEERRKRQKKVGVKKKHREKICNAIVSLFCVYAKTLLMCSSPSHHFAHVKSVCMVLKWKNSRYL